MASLRHGFHGRLRPRGSGCQCGNTPAIHHHAALRRLAGLPGRSHCGDRSGSPEAWPAAGSAEIWITHGVGARINEAVAR